MQAIILLEGSFNYYMKLIFAQRVMISAQDKGQIPIYIRSAKQDDNYGASNIVLPCPGS